MSRKYLPDASPATLITNDLFLAAFLSTVGCTLDHLESNGRQRISFVFVGERVQDLRAAYRTGKVSVDMRLFRENLNTLRDRLSATACGFHPEERSFSHASARLNPRRTRHQLSTRLPSLPHR